MSRDEIKGREHLVERHRQMTAVFKRFATAWPMAFAPSKWDVIMDTWLDNLQQVDTDVLDRAAREFLRKTKPQYPPKPWDFADFAWRYQGQVAVSHSGLVQGPGTAPVRRVWEWVSPLSWRINRVEEFADGFACSNLDDQREFDAFTAAGKIEYCEHMVHEYSHTLLRSA